MPKEYKWNQIIYRTNLITFMHKYKQRNKIKISGQGYSSCNGVPEYCLNYESRYTALHKKFSIVTIEFKEEK